MNVTDRCDGQARFSFSNVSFDDGSPPLLVIVISSVGVSFAQKASLPFGTTAGFLAESNPPVQPNSALAS